MDDGYNIERLLGRIERLPEADALLECHGRIDDGFDSLYTFSSQHCQPPRAVNVNISVGVLWVLTNDNWVDNPVEDVIGVQHGVFSP